MNGFPHLMFWPTSDRLRSLVLCLAICAGLVGSFEPVLAQVSTGQQAISAGGPSEPPVGPPEERPLAGGTGWSIGDWLLSPTLDLSTFYDSNIHGSPTAPLSGPGIQIHPSLLAEMDTGIHDTKFYGNIDSEIYPTLNYMNNTFNRQAGVIESYAPLRDLSFTVQGDYTHNTNANVVVSAIPTPISSAANPTPLGAQGVVANQQTVVDPNDTYTATASMYKALNRAFLDLGASISRTEYETMPTSDFDRGTFNGSGGAWLTPYFYAFADGIDSNTVPSIGSISNSYRARGGIGSDEIRLFQGSVYYGQQGTAVENGGTAGGDIYGGLLSYFPTGAWDMSLSVDRLRNKSDISSVNQFGIGGLSLVAAPIPTGSSTQITTIAYRSNYTFSPQTSFYGVVSDSRIDFLDSPRIDNSWLASVGVRHQLRDNLSMTLDYQYTRYISEEPLTSFTHNLVSLGAHYKF